MGALSNEYSWGWIVYQRSQHWGEATTLYPAVPGLVMTNSLLSKIAIESSLIYPCSKWWCSIVTGRWFGTCFIFPYIGNNHPNWLIFFRGDQATNQVMHKPQWTTNPGFYLSPIGYPAAGKHHHLREVVFRWQPLGFPWDLHGIFVGFPWVVHGFFHGFFHGFSMAFPWFFHGFSWVFHGFFHRSSIVFQAAYSAQGPGVGLIYLVVRRSCWERLGYRTIPFNVGPPGYVCWFITFYNPI